MNEQNIISKRIEEVKAESTQLRAKLAENGKELAELESAANVVARLMNAGGALEAAHPAAPSRPAVNVEEPSEKRNGFPTMPELIIMALKHERRPMEPREITEVIRRNWWPEVESKKIGSIVWRLKNRDDIEKVEGTATYRLPQKDEGPDENLTGGTSEPSGPETPAEGREAVPGGGP